jgi:hypothetical protein
LRERSETTSGTDDGNSLARACPRFLEALVNGDTSAEDRSYSIERNVFVQTSDVGSLGNAVLLE